MCVKQGTQFEEWYLIISCSGGGAVHGPDHEVGCRRGSADATRTEQVDSGWREPGSMGGGDSCYCAHKDNVCISWMLSAFSRRDSDSSVEPSSPRVRFEDPRVSLCFPFVSCFLLIILGLCLLYLLTRESERCSGPFHWKHHANLGTNFSCPRWPPQICELEPFKPVLELVLSANLCVLSCSSRVCSPSEAWLRRRPQKWPHLQVTQHFWPPVFRAWLILW